MEFVNGAIDQVMTIGGTVLTFITGNQLLMIPVGAALLGIGIGVVKRFLPRR